MVHTERTDKCPSNSPSAAAVKSQPANSSHKSSSDNSSYRSGSSSSSSSTHKVDSDKWKYNRMVKDDREKFNSLHHC